MADSYWDILAAGIAAYFANKGTSGSTPNQYPVALPPEAKRVADEAWNVYKSGGSPAQKSVMGAGMQFLGGMPTTAPNFSFTSDALQGQTFAGGVTVPKIDISKLPLGGGGTPAGPPPKSGNTINDNRDKFPNTNTERFAGGPNGFGRRQDDMGASDDNESIYRYMSRNPNASFRDVNDRLGYMPPPPGADTADAPDGSFAKIKDAFTQWQQQHPNWAKLGPAAAIGFISGGLPGLAVGVIEAGIKRLFAPPKPGVSTNPGKPTIPTGGSPSTVLGGGGRP